MWECARYIYNIYVFMLLFGSTQKSHDSIRRIPCGIFVCLKFERNVWCFVGKSLLKKKKEFKQSDEKKKHCKATQSLFGNIQSKYFFQEIFTVNTKN